MPSKNVTRGYGRLEGFLARQRAKKADSLIPSLYRSGRLLDIGCGTYPLFLTGTEFSGKYGLDKVIQNDACKDLNISGITLINHDFEKDGSLPFGDCFLSVVTMLAVFEHLETEILVKISKEIRRVLVPGGLFILTTPASWTDSLLRVMARLGLVSPDEINEHKNAFTHKKIAVILKGADFERQKMRFGYFEAFMNIWAAAEK